MLEILLLIIHIVVAVLMCIVILMQSAKGEGLSGAFGMGQGTSTFFGADTANVLVKITTALAVIFMLTSLSLAYIKARKASSVTEKEPRAAAAAEAAVGASPEEEATPPEEGATPEAGGTVEGEADETTEGEAPSAEEPEEPAAGPGGPALQPDETKEPGSGETEERPSTES